MKELSIEQKAKRYDEAIKLAKDSFNYPDYPGFIRADVVFPEIKESEDERIRKELIDYHRSMAAQADDYVHEVWIAWLEKQNDNTLNTNIKSCIEMILTDADEQRFKDYNTNLAVCLAWLKRQGKEKPIDWSDYDKTMAFTLMRDVDQMACISKEAKNERIGWLNSLDEKFINYD